MKINIKETNLRANGYLNERPLTDQLVIHHTGERDIDASAEEIDKWHKNQDWAMIGYHFVIRKDGSIERGRPEASIGAHAFGDNSHTLGIHLSGDFMTAYPTKQQIESTAMLCAYLCEKYKIQCTRDNIVGHCELMATDCPGKNLYDQLDLIVGKANYYINNSQHNDNQNQGLPLAEVKTIDVIHIHSEKPLDDDDINNIRDIINSSNCPNESLNSINNYNRIDGNNIFIGNEDNYLVTVVL